MKIHDLEQGSDEWFALRRGRLTASQYDTVFNEKTMKLNIATSENHMDGMFGEMKCTEEDRPVFKPSFAMERGTRLEPFARVDFELRTGIDVTEVGFVTNEAFGDHIGCSPDGLVDGGKGGIEIKCPMPKAHNRYLRMGVLPKVYRAQVHGCMAVCEADYWWFTSYCPNFKDFTLKVYRDEYTASIAQALKEFNKLFAQRLSETKHLANG
jgi:hypothetical protein